VKILVTGARGQLGGELCRLLADHAIPLDVNDLDLTDGPAARKTLRQLKPELVINCAAFTQVDQAEREPQLCRAVNADAVAYLAESCGELDCPLVQISTDYVFGGGPDPGRPYREDDPTSPQGVYAQTKLAGERAAARHSKYLIVRTCGLYARPTDQQAHNFVKTMLRLGSSGKPISVVGDQHCTPSYVSHVAQAVLFLAGVRISSHVPAIAQPTISFVPPAPWGIYHVTNNGQTTWYEFALELFRLSGMDVPIEKITTADYNAVAPRPAYSVLDITAYSRLGGPVMPDWKTALEEYIRDLQ
jgi:dTDP-4-dehydrorhamnose reductase